MTPPAIVKQAHPELRSVAEVSSRLARGSIFWTVALGVFVIASAVIASMWGGSKLWTLERLEVEQRGAVIGADGAWFVWGKDVRRDATPRVFSTPGGAPLAGSWSVWDWRGGPRLTGRGVPSTSAPDTPGRWSGEAVSRREIDGVSWTEFVRIGYARDFRTLGRDPAFVGTWQGGVWGADGPFRFASDGTILDTAGRDVGRWAGRGRILLVHCRGPTGSYVNRFVASTMRNAQGREIPCYRTLGCAVSHLWR